MPEVGLGVGCYQGEVGGVSQEILTWYDNRGDRCLSEAEQERSRAEQQQVRAEQEQRQRERLEAYLRSQGIDPNQLPD